MVFEDVYISTSQNKEKKLKTQDLLLNEMRRTPPLLNIKSYEFRDKKTNNSKQFENRRTPFSMNYNMKTQFPLNNYDVLLNSELKGNYPLSK